MPAHLRPDGFNLSWVETILSNFAQGAGNSSVGTPFRNLQRLQQLGVRVTCQEHPLEEFAALLDAHLPIIASVNTADFTYSATAVDHAVLIVGIDAHNVHIHDPALAHGPIPISRTEFALAQLKFDHLCAVIQR